MISDYLKKKIVYKTKKKYILNLSITSKIKKKKENKNNIFLISGVLVIFILILKIIIFSNFNKNKLCY